jgi:predicted ATP-grasp superfamily ATP-dependent carboligase
MCTNYCNKRVLVLGGEENPALPVLKSLGKKGIHITVASHKKTAPGLYSKYTTLRMISPDPWRDEKIYIDWALNICRSGMFDLIIPLGEKATLWIAKNQEKFVKYVNTPFPEIAVYMIARDKALTMKAARQFSIPIPKTFFPDEEALISIAKKIKYPVVVKPRISYGARGIYYPENPQELKSMYEMAVEEYGPCIIQEYIPQTGMQYKAESVVDKNNKVLAVGVYDKPRYYPVSGGSSTLNRTVYRPDINTLSTQFLEGIKWYGIADIDFIEDPRDGQIKMMEMNPRFTRSIRILVEAGLDLPSYLFDIALNKHPETKDDYLIDLHMRYALPDCMWFVKSQDRWISKPNFFNFFGKNQIFEMFSFNDPLPGLVYLYTQIFNLLSPKSMKTLLRN